MNTMRAADGFGTDPAHAELPPEWNILIVDDDEDVHTITQMILERVRFHDRPVLCHSARSARDALALLSGRTFSVALIDVVMETDTAGLDLIRTIRGMPAHNLMRIILRTGQPGSAPENSVISAYDINDYREKTDMTAQKLTTAVVAALRSHSDLMTIERNRQGLRRVILATTDLFSGQTLQRFAEIGLRQIAQIHPETGALPSERLSSFFAGGGPVGSIVVLAASGMYAPYEGMLLDALLMEHEGVRNDVAACLLQGNGLLAGNRLTLYHPGTAGTPNFIHLDGIADLSDGDLDLLEVFHSTLSIAFDNLRIRQEADDTQREIIFNLGEVIEGRSRETGAHVKRMTEISRLLARRHGLPEDQVEMLVLAAPLHDIGKLSIPDSILTKPGRLEPQEFDIIKSHTRFGYDILKRSNRAVFKAAARIALSHHERWDGTGYPDGLHGEDIDLFARIVAVADVFDALTSDRVYKKAWPMAEAVDYILAQGGRQFDPALCATFAGCTAELAEILAQGNDPQDAVRFVQTLAGETE